MFGVQLGRYFRQYAIVLTVMFLSPILMDTLGRKLCTILSYVPHILACVLFLAATKAWMLVLGRVLTGVNLAIIFCVAPTYAAEIASKEIRGGLGVLFQVSCCTGILIMLSVGPFVSYGTLSILYTAIVVISAVPSLFLPDSPYFLYSKGKTAEAIDILINLRGSEELAAREIEEYKMADGTNKINKLDLLKDIVFLKAVTIAMICGALGHLSGASALTYYMQSIFESTKTNVSSEVASAVVGAIKVAATLVAACISDSFGRKPIMVWTWIGKAVGMIGLGTYFFELSPDMSAFVNYIPLICIMLVVFCHNAGQNSLYFVVVAELFEGPSRAVGVTVSFFISAVLNFFLAMYLGSLITLLGPAVTYWSFGVICLLSVLFYMLFLPETKGKSFFEIQEKLGRRR